MNRGVLDPPGSEEYVQNAFASPSDARGRLCHCTRTSAEKSRTTSGEVESNRGFGNKGAFDKRLLAYRPTGGRITQRWDRHHGL